MKDKCKNREIIESRIENRYRVREILIVLCMAVLRPKVSKAVKFGQ